MTFNKTTTYAIMMLSHMAEHPDKRYSATYLSDKLNIPLQYCRQILTDLSKKQLIESKYGRSGGFSFKKSTSEVFLSEIVDAVEGMNSFNRCIMGFESCPMSKDSHCALHAPWEKSRNSLIEVLENTSLSTFLHH